MEPGVAVLLMDQVGEIVQAGIDLLGLVHGGLIAGAVVLVQGLLGRLKVLGPLGHQLVVTASVVVHFAPPFYSGCAR